MPFILSQCSLFVNIFLQKITIYMVEKMQIENMFKKFIGSQKSMVSLKKSSISTYTYNFNAYIKPFFQDKELSERSVREFTKFLLFKLSEKTVNDILTLFSSILCKNRIDIEIYKPKFRVPVIKGLTDEEWCTLEDYCLCHLNYQAYCVLLSLYTGARPGEICACKKENLNLNAHLLSIFETLQRIRNFDESSKRKTKIIIDDAKSFKAFRDVPVIDDLVLIGNNLYKNVPANAFLLTGRTDKFIEVRTWENQVKKIFVKVGIEGSPYTLRHAFATRFYYLTGDIKTLAELLGHASIQTTYRYIFTSDEQKRQGINSLISNRCLLS